MAKASGMGQTKGMSIVSSEEDEIQGFDQQNNNTSKDPKLIQP